MMLQIKHNHVTTHTPPSSYSYHIYSYLFLFLLLLPAFSNMCLMLEVGFATRFGIPWIIRIGTKMILL